MKDQLISRINTHITEQGYKPHTIEWNICNQLIDIVAISDEDTATIINCDLDIKSMSITDLIKHITNQRIADPVQVMYAICEFYKILAPIKLPMEYWRQAEQQAEQSNVSQSTAPTPPPPPSTTKISLLDLI